jgi:hypothetical protein
LINELPRFIIYDIKGSKVDSDSLLGRDVYIQFVNAHSPSDVDFFRIVYEKWLNENLQIIAITDSEDALIERLGGAPSSATIIEDAANDLGRLFGDPQNHSSYYLFDKKGIIVSAGTSSRDYEDSLKIHLLKMVKNRVFDIAEFINPSDKLRESPSFKSVSQYLERETKEYYLFSFFSLWCNSCTMAPIIDELNRIYGTHNNRIFMLGILNSDYYSLADIDALVSQAKVDFPIVVSDSGLTSKWTSLIREYNRGELNSIIILTNRDGRLLRIYHPGCQCLSAFIKYLEATGLEENRYNEYGD